MKETNEDFLKTLILDIENTPSQLITKQLIDDSFELQPHQRLLSGLAGQYGVLFVRALFDRLNINEHHVFKWRLENKYVQYLVLNHYAPGCMPETISLAELLKGKETDEIKAFFEKDFFLKITLGHSSGKNGNFDRTAEFDNIFQSYQIQSPQNEKWILQKKIQLNKEFRIHSFNKDIIDGLTFMINGSYSTTDSDNAFCFLKEILNSIPDNILQGTLIGWDIGLTDDYKFYVIEANFTGFHPEYHRGFQASGYFDDETFGPIYCTILNNYFKDKYGVFINSIDKNLKFNNMFYKALLYYNSVLDTAYFNGSHQVKKEVTLIYPGDIIDLLIVRLISYFNTINFTGKYCIISKGADLKNITNLFGKGNNINILTEQELFTNEQYQLIKQLSYDRRKVASCYYALRQMREDSYIII